MGLAFTWLGLEKSDPPSPGDLEKPDPNANPGSYTYYRLLLTANLRNKHLRVKWAKKSISISTFR